MRLTSLSPCLCSLEEGHVPAVGPQVAPRPTFRDVAPPPASARSLRQARRRDQHTESGGQVPPRTAVAKPVQTPGGSAFEY
jgi:hypothetical protein